MSVWGVNPLYWKEQHRCNAQVSIIDFTITCDKTSNINLDITKLKLIELDRHFKPSR